MSLIADGEKGRSMIDRWLSELTVAGGFEGRTGVLPSGKNAMNNHGSMDKRNTPIMDGP